MKTCLFLLKVNINQSFRYADFSSSLFLILIHVRFAMHMKSKSYSKKTKRSPVFLTKMNKKNLSTQTHAQTLTNTQTTTKHVYTRDRQTCLCAWSIIFAIYSTFFSTFCCSRNHSVYNFVMITNDNVLLSLFSSRIYQNFDVPLIFCSYI